MKKLLIALLALAVAAGAAVLTIITLTDHAKDPSASDRSGSAWSDVSTDPDQPRMSVIRKDAGYTIRWTAYPSAAKYCVFLRDEAGWNKIGETAETQIDYEEPTEQTTYTYAVRPLNAAGEYLSDRIEAGYTVSYAAVPMFDNILPGVSGTVLTWSAYEGAQTYRLYRRYLDTQWSAVADVDGLTYTDSAPSDGVPCQYKLCCLDKDGNTLDESIDDRKFYRDGVLADGVLNIKGYLCTFDKGKLTKGYVTAEDIVRIAEAEVGTVATDIKCCKYNTWYYGYEASGDMYDWCVVFVDWVFNQAGGYELLNGDAAGAEILGQQFYNMDRLVMSDFRVGDLLLLHWKEGESGFVPGVQHLNHVGIIISVNDDGSYTTIEGNTGDDPNGAVMIKVRYPELISCACRPKYGYTIPAN